MYFHANTNRECRCVLSKKPKIFWAVGTAMYLDNELDSKKKIDAVFNLHVDFLANKVEFNASLIRFELRWEENPSDSAVISDQLMQSTDLIPDETVSPISNIISATSPTFHERCWSSKFNLKAKCNCLRVNNENLLTSNVKVDIGEQVEINWWAIYFDLRSFCV